MCFTHNSYFFIGMSGKFAAADNTFQYYEGLSNKVNLVTGDFGKLQNHPELPKWTGKINTLDKFDLGFFGEFTEFN